MRRHATPILGAKRHAALHRQLDLALDERRPLRAQLAHRHPQAPPVRIGAVARARDHLRRHELGGADHRVGGDLLAGLLVRDRREASLDAGGSTTEYLEESIATAFRSRVGWLGLFLSYVICGAAANLVSLVLLPSATVSLGALPPKPPSRRSQMHQAAVPYTAGADEP